jgi:hypothetical protein
MWYYQINEKAEGPIEDDQLQALIASRTISRKTLVWKDGLADWIPAEDTELSARFPSGPPPITRRENAPPLPPKPSIPSTAPFPLGFHNPTRLASWVSALLALSLLVAVVAIWSSSQQLDLLERIKSRGQFTMAEANASDARQRLIGVMQLILFVTTAIVFGRWIYVVARNVRIFGAQNLRFTPGWAVGFYFVPVANLWKPYQAMKEVWKASRTPGGWEREKGSFILGFWWTFWVISCLVGQMSLRAAMSPQKPNDYIDAATFTMFSDVVDIPLCIFAIFLVRSLSTRQVATATNVS